MRTEHYLTVHRERKPPAHLWGDTAARGGRGAACGHEVLPRVGRRQWAVAQPDSLTPLGTHGNNWVPTKAADAHGVPAWSQTCSGAWCGGGGDSGISPGNFLNYLKSGLLACNRFGIPELVEEKTPLGPKKGLCWNEGGVTAP